jgi:uroporphyrinogen-III decarboxylase
VLIRCAAANDLARLRPYEPATDTPYVTETVRLVVRELASTVPLLAFAGAPFTGAQLPRRGPAVAHVRAHEGADPH